MAPDSTTQSNSYEEFIAEVREEARLIDILVVLTPPIILTLVYMLPESIQHSLILEDHDPLLINLWSSAYVHRGVGHFFNNVSAYILLSVILTPLFILSNSRKLLQGTFVAFLFILPPFIAITSIYVYRGGT